MKNKTRGNIKTLNIIIMIQTWYNVQYLPWKCRCTVKANVFNFTISVFTQFIRDISSGALVRTCRLSDSSKNEGVLIFWKRLIQFFYKKITCVILIKTISIFYCSTLPIKKTCRFLLSIFIIRAWKNRQRKTKDALTNKVDTH